MSREEAIERDPGAGRRAEEALREDASRSAEKHGITTDDELREASVQWVLQNPDMHTVCVGMRDFDDRSTSSSPCPAPAERWRTAEFLDDYRVAFDSRYCRHGCTSVVGSAPTTCR